MGALEFFRPTIKTLHSSLMDAVKDLTDEKLHFRPLGKGNHIAFILWHTVRTEDSVLNFLLQKKPPVWNAVRGIRMMNSQALPRMAKGVKK